MTPQPLIAMCLAHCAPSRNNTHGAYQPAAALRRAEMEDEVERI